MDTTLRAGAVPTGKFVDDCGCTYVVWDEVIHTAEERCDDHAEDYCGGRDPKFPIACQFPKGHLWPCIGPDEPEG